jgi:hypothetical protein
MGDAPTNAVSESTSALAEVAVVGSPVTVVGVDVTFVTHSTASADCEPAAMKMALSAMALIEESSGRHDAEKVGFRPEITVRMNATPYKYSMR